MSRATRYLTMLTIGMVFPLNAVASNRQGGGADLPVVTCNYCVTVTDKDGNIVANKCVVVPCKQALAPVGTPVGSLCSIRRGKIVLRTGQVTAARICESPKPMLAR